MISVRVVDVIVTKEKRSEENRHSRFINVIIKGIEIENNRMLFKKDKNFQNFRRYAYSHYKNYRMIIEKKSCFSKQDSIHCSSVD